MSAARLDGIHHRQAMQKIPGFALLFRGVVRSSRNPPGAHYVFSMNHGGSVTESFPFPEETFDYGFAAAGLLMSLWSYLRVRKPQISSERLAE